ncbi:MAG: NUDIX hydrolase [Aggregatilineales bacterium]
MSRFYRRLATVVQAAPILIRIPYFFYRRIQPRYTVGVIGVVMNPAGQVLLVEHVFHPEIPWGLPGGWIGRNEAPQDAVMREIREELSLIVESVSLLHMEKTEDNHLDIAFLCQVAPDSEIGTLSYELLSYKWHDPGTLPRLHKFHYDTIQKVLNTRQYDHMESVL